ncbi:MAG: rhomboid family intramembrane serine protease [Clostridia bacterium]|nr:rhomboid family intramembrane serine protease [Clostridia bacterium]
MDIKIYFEYNAVVTLTYFLICFVVLILNYLTKGKSNDWFTCRRRSIWSLKTYVCLITHAFGHVDWDHFYRNFLMILLIGPLIEEKYGATTFLVMILVTALITGIINVLFSSRGCIGASCVDYMLIVLSSCVNLSENKIPLTLVMIMIFYVVDEVRKLILRKHDGVSHIGHVTGAVCRSSFWIFDVKSYGGKLA